MLSWALEAYDKDRKAWITLAAPAETLTSPHGVGSWSVRANGKYRYLRVRSTGLNGKGTKELPICAIELYGTLYRGE